MSGSLHGIAWGHTGLDITCIWYGTTKAPRSPGSVVPRNVYYPNKGELALHYSRCRRWHHSTESVIFWTTCLVRDRPRMRR